MLAVRVAVGDGMVVDVKGWGGSGNGMVVDVKGRGSNVGWDGGRCWQLGQQFL